MSFVKKISTPMLVLGLASPVLANCGALPGIPGADCPGLKDGNFASMKFEGGAEVEGKLKGFLEAVYAFDKVAAELEASLVASCTELGTALEVPEADMKAGEGEEPAKKACAAVAAKIEGTLKASASVKLGMEVGEPKCYVDVEAMTSCLGECGAAIEPGEISASCEGGEISGECSGECKGSCTLEAGAECSGKCEGTCKGKCDGKDTEGSCAGKCEGECSASCKVEGAAECKGSCSGECSVEMKAPQCSGEFKPPKVDAECHMNCTAKTAGSAKCDPPSLAITVEGEASADIEKLVAALQVSLPKIIKIQVGTAAKLAASGEALVAAGAEMPDVAAKAGLSAVGCITQAVSMQAEASASVSVNVEASASVSGSAGAG
jgi:hypothetical protein